MDFVARAGPTVAALAVSMALARSASGQNAPPAEREKVRLLYEAPESCTAREQFLPQVRARLGSDWEAAPGELARTIHVKVSLTGERYVARIELQDARGKQVARAVAGAQCEQVIEGIALVTVLAIEAQLDELLSESEPIADEPTPSSSPPVPPAPAQPARTNAKAPDQPARPPPPPSSSEVKLRVGARAQIHDGAGPGLGTGFGAFAAVVWPSVVLGLAVDAVGTGEVEARVVKARFNLLAARLDGCGRFPVVSASISVEPCLFLQGGSLEGQGDRDPPQVARGGADAAIWLVPGALLAVRGELGPVLLGLEGSAGLTLNWVQFYIANPDAEGDREVVYEVPWLAAGAAFSAGVTF